MGFPAGGVIELQVFFSLFGLFEVFYNGHLLLLTTGTKTIQ